MLKDTIQKEIAKLMISHDELQKNLKSQDTITFQIGYHVWYGLALKIIKTIIPERMEEFQSLYLSNNLPKPEPNQFNIQDYIINNMLYFNGNIIHINKNLDIRSTITANRLNTQCNILLSVLAIYNSKLLVLKQLLSSDITEKELESAQHLLDNNYVRAAGAICGVILEKHLLQIINQYPNIIIEKKDMNISDYNDLLKKNEIFDIPTWRSIQVLADIRNLCDHKKEKDPTKENVQDLINGTSKFKQTNF